MSDFETGSVLDAGNPAPANPATPPAGNDGGQAPINVNAPGVDNAPPPDLSWLDALGEDGKGFAANKAWKTPGDMLESYRNLEKLVGRKGRDIPEADDAEAWSKFYNELGRPETADGYKFDLPDEYNPELVKFYQDAAHKAGLTKRQADAFLTDYLDFEHAAREEYAKQNASRVDMATAELKREWGAKFDENLNVALRGANALGLSQDERIALEESMGQAKAARLFERVGRALCSEDGTPNTPGNSGFGVRTPAEAQARIDELLSRPDYQKAYMDGDKTKVAEIQALYDQVAAGRGQG